MIRPSPYFGSHERARALLERLYLHRDAIVWAALFVLAILSRLAYAGQVLYHWDSINFAFSLERFDVAAGRPHAPGYILYVGLGMLVNVLLGERSLHGAQMTFVAISIAGSGLAVAFLYVLGRDLFNRQVGLAAALFLVTSPLFWFYGEIALPHSLDTFAVILTVWLFYRLARGEGRFAGPPAVVLAAVWFGVAGGLRPQTQVFLAPLALYAGWRIGWRRSLLALAVLALVDLAWFVPLVTLNGGLARYISVMGQFSEAFNSTTSVLSGAGLWGLARNLRKLIMYTLYGWSLAAAAFGLGAVALLFPRTARFKREARSFLRSGLHRVHFWVFSLWITPTVLYYTFIHMGQQGLVFVYLPALLLLSAAVLLGLVENLPSFRKAAWTGAVVFIAAANSAIFLFAPTYPTGGSLKLLTADTLRRHDASHLALLEGIQANFDADHTLILASWWRFPQYYLRDYTLIHFDVGARWEIDEGQGSLPDETLDKVMALGIVPDEGGFLPIDAGLLGLTPDEGGYFYLLLFDESLAKFNRSPERQERVPLPEGGRLSFIRFTQQEMFHLGSEAFDIVPLASGASVR